MWFTFPENILYIYIYIKAKEVACRKLPADGGFSNLMPQAMPNLETLNVYQPRNPQAGGYYKCVESHFEELERIWDDHYAPRGRLGSDQADRYNSIG